MVPRPPKSATDCHTVIRQVNFHIESVEEAYNLPFVIDRQTGYYYLQVRTILFRIQNGKVFGQAEQFFFSRQPILISDDPNRGITLPVSWPAEPLDELAYYGTVHPKSNLDS